MKREDILASPKFKKVMEEFNEGSLKSSSGQRVNSRAQATAIAASESGQSYTDAVKERKTADRFGVKGTK